MATVSAFREANVSPWDGFHDGLWQTEINVRDFIQQNNRPYYGDELVPELTDNLNDIAELAGFAASLGNVERVDVLPFHQMGKFKWDQLGIQYQHGHTEPPHEVTEKVCGQFRHAGLKAY